MLIQPAPSVKAVASIGAVSGGDARSSGMADTKNWTWVLERTCPECGFDAPSLGRDQIAPTVRGATDRFAEALGGADVRVRPAPEVWSTLEYACHLRDVCRIYQGRVRLMLDDDDARFADWDQDATAAEADYAHQDPDQVRTELMGAAVAVAAEFDGVTDAGWARTGLRSDGSAFTVESLGRYMAHDLVHHVWDIDQSGA
jgi:hypothetical protein